MICPHCKKIIAEGSTNCQFCKTQFNTFTSNNADSENAPTQPQMPHILTPAQEYQELGGLLKFIVVVWKKVAFIVLLLVAASSLLSATISFIIDYSWEPIKPTVHLFYYVAFYITAAVIYRKIAVKIERKDPSFLSFWQKTFISLEVLSIIENFWFSGAVSALLSIAMSAILFCLYELYFVKSVRVYNYMGSSAYLRNSFINKNTPSPKPNKDKNAKVKIIVLVVVLILMLEGLNICKFYYSFKQVALPVYQETSATAQSDKESKDVEVTFSSEQFNLLFGENLSQEGLGKKFTDYFGDNAYTTIKTQDNTAKVIISGKDSIACKKICTDSIYTLAKQLSKENAGVFCFLEDNYAKIIIMQLGSDSVSADKSAKDLLFYFICLQAFEGRDSEHYYSYRRKVDSGWTMYYFLNSQDPIVINSIT